MIRLNCKCGWSYQQSTSRVLATKKAMISLVLSTIDELCLTTETNDKFGLINRLRVSIVLVVCGDQIDDN